MAPGNRAQEIGKCTQILMYPSHFQCLRNGFSQFITLLYNWRIFFFVSNENMEEVGLAYFLTVKNFEMSKKGISIMIDSS